MGKWRKECVSNWKNTAKICLRINKVKNLNKSNETTLRNPKNILEEMNILLDKKIGKIFQNIKKIMINPRTISEQLLFSTIRLQTDQGIGTGFIFMFQGKNQQTIPVIITNKHVINNNDKKKVRFFLHIKENDLPVDSYMEVEYVADWIFHNDSNIDLCCMPLAPLLHNIKKERSQEIFFIPITEDIIWSNEKLDELQAVEDVLMFGYPIGLFDKENNFPLIRKGITASHPAINYNSESMGVIDIACFPGSSGSPVFILNDNGYTDKNGNIFIGRKRIIFLGILFAGPILDVRGDIEIQAIPVQQKVILNTKVMINLGYYIKAKELLVLKKQFLGKYNL